MRRVCPAMELQASYVEGPASGLELFAAQLFLYDFFIPP